MKLRLVKLFNDYYKIKQIVINITINLSINFIYCYVFFLLCYSYCKHGVGRFLALYYLNLLMLFPPNFYRCSLKIFWFIHPSLSWLRYPSFIYPFYFVFPRFSVTMSNSTYRKSTEELLEINGAFVLGGLFIFI